MKAETTRQQVIRFCSGHGVTAKRSRDVVTLSRDLINGDVWVELFDDWTAAMSYLVKQRNDHQDLSTTYAWSDK